MSSNRGSGRNQRNNPYQLEELFIKFHHTPAGIAWRWRTELLVLTGLAVAFWRLDTWTTAIWANSSRVAVELPGAPALSPAGSPPLPGIACWS